MPLVTVIAVHLGVYVRLGHVPQEEGISVTFTASAVFSNAQSKKRGGVLQGEGEVITATAEHNCGAILNIDSLIYFNLKHHQTRNVPQSIIFSQMPL